MAGRAPALRGGLSAGIADSPLPPIVEDSSTIQRRPGGLVEAGLVSHLEAAFQQGVRPQHRGVHTAKRITSLHKLS